MRRKQPTTANNSAKLPTLLVRIGGFSASEQRISPKVTDCNGQQIL
ncbi:hypothetical protein [Pseudoalteromonas prydzensis]